MCYIAINLHELPARLETFWDVTQLTTPVSPSSSSSSSWCICGVKFDKTNRALVEVRGSATLTYKAPYNSRHATDTGAPGGFHLSIVSPQCTISLLSLLSLLTLRSLLTLLILLGETPPCLLMLSQQLSAACSHFRSQPTEPSPCAKKTTTASLSLLGYCRNMDAASSPKRMSQDCAAPGRPLESIAAAIRATPGSERVQRGGRRRRRQGPRYVLVEAIRLLRGSAGDVEKDCALSASAGSAAMQGSQAAGGVLSFENQTQEEKREEESEEEEEREGTAVDVPLQQTQQAA
ncbi:hypothetical protein EYF80_043912 [Liparis tanakae]|uniref:Uncharacterized protein n=1 Tax=Liparis tanakae TaxID=230148 RepID=A0A4Z2FYB4_9TELE|nr:hypothetical protein EYF80_043912 [Liparis tanakae]